MISHLYYIVSFCSIFYITIGIITYTLRAGAVQRHLYLTIWFNFVVLFFVAVLIFIFCQGYLYEFHLREIFLIILLIMYLVLLFFLKIDLTNPKRINTIKHFILNAPIGFICICIVFIILTGPVWPSWYLTPSHEFILFLKEQIVPNNILDFLQYIDLEDLSSQETLELYVDCISLKIQIPLDIVQNYFNCINYTKISKYRYLRLMLMYAFQEDGVATLRDIMHCESAHAHVDQKFLVLHNRCIQYVPSYRDIEKFLVDYYYCKWFKD